MNVLGHRQRREDGNDAPIARPKVWPERGRGIKRRGVLHDGTFLFST